MLKFAFFAAAVMATTMTVPSFAAPADGRTGALPGPASTPSRALLVTLIDAMPNGADVLTPYTTAKTINQIENANTLLRKEIIQGRSVEKDLDQIYLGAMQSCELADQLERPQIDVIAGKARALKGVADDVDGRIKNSIADMKRLAEARGAGAYRLKHEVEEYDAAYAEFIQLRLEIQEMVKGLEKLAATMPEAKAICRPSTIPPLTKNQPAPNPAPTPVKRRSRSARPHARASQLYWSPVQPAW